jgi:hypothetical protein
MYYFSDPRALFNAGKIQL